MAESFETRWTTRLAALFHDNVPDVLKTLPAELDELPLESVCGRDVYAVLSKGAALIEELDKAADFYRDELARMIYAGAMIFWRG